MEYGVCVAALDSPSQGIFDRHAPYAALAHQPD